MIETYSNRQYIDNLKALGAEQMESPTKANGSYYIAIFLVIGIGIAIGYNIWKKQQEKRYA